MRHDAKYSQSHSSAVKQRPDGSYHYPAGGHYGDHHMGKHYHSREGSSSGYLYSDRRNGYSSSSNLADSGIGGHASALSGSSSHESEKQWEWLEEVLAKSSRNKETVSMRQTDFYLPFYTKRLCKLLGFFMSNGVRCGIYVLLSRAATADLPKQSFFRLSGSFTTEFCESYTINQ